MSTDVLPGLVGRTDTGTSTTIETDVTPDLSHGYVDKNKIVESAVTGDPVVALCGKVWTPSRDPKRFPVCPECKEIYEGLPEGGDD